ncbi:MAG: hypothetical protein M1814_002584 [Vezdaea aestivalis]|nr:MAG: hypothetical protein M1814_002584 [Vezdaea aestivalis]
MMEALLRERQSTEKGGSSEEQDRITAEAAEALHHLRSYSPDSAGSPGAFPIYEGNARFASLFDNAVLTRQRDGESCQGSNYSSPNNSTNDHASPAGSQSKPSRERNLRSRKALLELLPHTTELHKILEDSTQFLQTWRKLISELGGCRPEMSLHQFVKWGLEQEDVTIVANALLAVGLAVQQRPPGSESVRLNLPLPPKKLLLHYLHVLETLNIPDDECAATADGIELIMVRAKIYDNLGMVRKGWLMFRRAIALIQMMGYHSTRPVYPGEPSGAIDRRNNIWYKLSFIDRWLSMILGLPFMLGDEPQPLEYLAKLGRTAKFRRRLTIIVGKVIKQSQSDSPPAVEPTLQIDQELNDLGSSMPLEWWDKKVAIASGTWDQSEVMEKSATQMWYHQSKAYLHLPFMLQSASDARFEYSRQACLEASRRIIGIYQEMRSGDKPFFIGRVFDFQGFVAGIFLLLGLLGYSHIPSTPSAQSQEDLDWHLVDSLISLMRRITHQDPSNTISSQSLSVLETLTAVGRSDPHPHDPHSSLKIAVPFFGTIHIHAPSTRTPSQTQTPSSRSTSNPPIPIPLADRTPSAAPPHVEPEYHDISIPTYTQHRLQSQQIPEPMAMDNSNAGLHSTAAPVTPNFGAWPQVDVNFENWMNMDLNEDWNWFGNGQPQPQMQPELAQLQVQAGYDAVPGMTYQNLGAQVGGMIGGRSVGMGEGYQETGRER